jgi:hypothetical protein
MKHIHLHTTTSSSQTQFGLLESIPCNFIFTTTIALLDDTFDLPNTIYARDAPPTVIHAAASKIEWPVTEGTTGLPVLHRKEVDGPF